MKVDGGYDAGKNMRGVSETNGRHVKERHVVAEAYLHLLREPLPSPFWFERFISWSEHHREFGIYLTWIMASSSSIGVSTMATGLG